MKDIFGEVFGHYQPSYQAQLREEAEKIRKEGKKGSESLQSHIYEAHFDPFIIYLLGIARFDIDLAHLLGFRLNSVVEAGYTRLEKGWPNYDFKPETAQKFESISVFAKQGIRWTEQNCQVFIVKNLRYIQQLGLGQVDWDRIRRSTPNADNISLDIDRDANDPAIPKQRIAAPILIPRMEVNDLYIYPEPAYRRNSESHFMNIEPIIPKIPKIKIQ